MISNNDLEKRVENIEKQIECLIKRPYRCEVCGEPTNGWIRVLWKTRYLCIKHYPVKEAK